MRRRVGLLATVAVVAVLVTMAVLTATSDPLDDCPVELTGEAGGQEVLVPVDELAPEGSVAEERAPVLEAADALDAPFGELRAGRFFEGPDAVPVPVEVAGALGLVRADPDPERRAGSLEVVELPAGAPVWRVGYAADAVTGGLVNDVVVLLVRGTDGSASALAFAAADGDPVGCVAVPAAGPADRIVTDQARERVVVATESAGAAVRLALLDPREGVAWERSVDGQVEAGAVHVAGDTVTLSRVGVDPARLGELVADGGLERPTVTAYALVDGEPTWTYPADDEVSGAAATVLDTHDPTGRPVVLTVRAPARPGGRPVSSVAVLTEQGRVAWERRLGTGLWAGEVWADRVVVQGPDRASGALLRAFDVEDGSPAWRLRSRDLPGPEGGAGDQPVRLERFGAGVDVGGDIVATAPGGLVVVDPEDGRSRLLPTDLEVTEVLPVGGALVVRVDTALLVLDVGGSG